ncbi:MAG: hypothetical protein H6571_09205 [Lewinellaceae bacterium]|nr:hypothetical protein [Lewinellaceae bacterium]
MENTKNTIQILTRIQLLSSIVWATIMIVSALVLGGGSYREISLILICGYLVEFLLLSSSKNKLKNTKQEKI